jgi:hypothetical protein
VTWGSGWRMRGSIHGSTVRENRCVSTRGLAKSGMDTCVVRCSCLRWWPAGSSRICEGFISTCWSAARPSGRPSRRWLGRCCAIYGMFRANQRYDGARVYALPPTIVAKFA